MGVNTEVQLMCADVILRSRSASYIRAITINVAVTSTSHIRFCVLLDFQVSETGTYVQ